MTEESACSPARPTLTRPPWYFRLAKHLVRTRRRGGYRLIEFAERRGWLACDVRYDLGGGVTLDVPLDRRSNQWAAPELLAYETALVEAFTAAAAAAPGPVRWIDVGADIGTLTALVLRRSPHIAAAECFEPNPQAFAYLARNAGRFPVPTTARRCAVADYAGRGELRASPADDSPHAMFLAPCATGPLDVVQLDDLFAWTDGTLLLKIDVEGGELAVLRGARRLLSTLPAWCVSLEAHRDVTRRTGVDPAECVRWFEMLRPVRVHVAERPDLAIDWTRDFFAQVPDDLRISNLVCRTAD